MTTGTQTGRWTNHLGRAAGRAWRWSARHDAQVVGWFARKGFSTGTAKALLWVFKLTLLLILLDVAFRLALLLMFIVVAAWLARDADLPSDKREGEWRTGHDGYGYYEKGTRTDYGRLFDEDD